jgi:putative ABC transport system permease protein
MVNHRFGVAILPVMWSDLRSAFRSFRRQPAFVATALLTLALGVGANTAIFSVVYGVLLRPLPYQRPEQLVRIYEEHPGGTSPLGMKWISDITLDAWRERKTLSGVAIFSGSMETVGRTEPERWRGGIVSPSLFGVLRVSPAAGRFFEEREALEGGSDVVVLSHDVWLERYGGRHDAIGQTLWLDGKPNQIVGVAPPGFSFPSKGLRFWRPYVLPSATGPGGQQRIRVMQAIARLSDGATAEQAAAEGTAAARSVPRPPSAFMMFGQGGPVVVHVNGYVDEMTRDIRPALMVLSIGVGFVLLIACANVANLLLSRGVVRQRELAVRAALGAGRSRLMRQLLTETVLLATLGGALGVLLAAWLIQVLPLVVPERFPRLSEVRLDRLTLLFGVGASIVTGVLSGVLPAIRGARTGLVSTMADGDLRATGSVAKRLRGGLLIVEAALAVMLLVGSALLIRSFVRLTSVDPGYSAERVLTGLVLLPVAVGATPASDTAETILERVRQLPGVVSAGAANMAPLAPVSAIRMLTLPERTPAGEPIQARAISWVVTTGFAESVGLRLKAGRMFRGSDLTDPIRSLIVNEEFVRLYWSDGRPVVGRRHDGVFGPKGETEIVGVVANTLKDGFDRQPEPEIYTLRRPGPQVALGRSLYLAVRADRDPMSLVADVRRAVLDLEPRAAFDDVSPLTTKVAASVAEPRFSAAVLAGFAGLAVLLAAVGLYGVLSYAVSERRREMGVRAALGASRLQLVGLVLREGLAVVIVGLALGLATAAALSRVMQRLLFGVSSMDPWVYIAAPAVLVVVATIACLIPARRAATVDPVEALRCE